MKRLVTTYTFDASSRIVTLDAVYNLEQILLITNTTDNVIIYNFSNPLAGGTLVNTTLTLTYDTTTMSDTDRLQIWVEDTTLDLASETTLAEIKAKTDNIPQLGQALSASSVPVILPSATITTLTPPAAITGYALETTQIASNSTLTTISNKDFATQTTLAAINTKIPASPATEGGNLATLAGKDFATQTTLSAINTKVPAQGQALAANSIPVVLPAAQVTTLTPPAAITGFALETTQVASNSTLTTIAGKDFATQTTLSALNTKVPAQGQALAANCIPVVLPTAQITTLTPPAAITGFATSALQTTSDGRLATIAANTATIVTNTSGLATQTTLASVSANTTTLVTNTTGLATQTTAANIASNTATLVTTAANQSTEATLKNVLGFQIPYYDEIVLTYVSAGNGVGEISTIVYKRATVTQATLTLSYNASNNVSGVVKT